MRLANTGMITAPVHSSRTPASAHIALAIAQVGFGLFPVAGKVVFEGGIPALGVASLRGVFGTLSLFVIATVAGAPSVASRRDLGWLALNAIFGIVVNQLLFLEGLQRSSATHGGVLVAATPAIAYALAIAARREAVHRGAIAGVLLAVLGAAWIALVKPLDPARAGSPTLFGDALLLTNVTSYAIYLVLVKDVLKRVDALRAIAWIFLFGALVNVPVGIPSLLQVHWGEVPVRSWGALAFVLLFPTTLCYALNTYALRRAPSTVVAVYTTSQPIVASLSAALVLGERPPLLHTAGATALILVGVVLVAFRRAPGPERP